jgi:hypothetical protein
MSQESAKTAPAAAPRSGTANLKPPWPRGVSGNPSGRSKRIPELFETMAADLGELTGIERALLWQAAKLMARSERAADANDSVRLANASARLLASLRNTRRKRAGRPPMRERLAEPAG